MLRNMHVVADVGGGRNDDKIIDRNVVPNGDKAGVLDDRCVSDSNIDAAVLQPVVIKRHVNGSARVKTG